MSVLPHGCGPTAWWEKDVSWVVVITGPPWAQTIRAGPPETPWTRLRPTCTHFIRGCFHFWGALHVEYQDEHFGIVKAFNLYLGRSSSNWHANSTCSAPQKWKQPRIPSVMYGIHVSSPESPRLPRGGTPLPTATYSQSEKTLISQSEKSRV